MNSQLEQGKSPWMLEGEGLRSTCPGKGTTTKPVSLGSKSPFETHINAFGKGIVTGGTKVRVGAILDQMNRHELPVRTREKSMEQWEKNRF